MSPEVFSRWQRVGAVLAASCILLPPPASGADLKIASNRDGAVILENDLIAVTVSGQTGNRMGLTQWTFKPTGGEMLDLIYGQAGSVKFPLFYPMWSGVTMPGYNRAAPKLGQLLIPAVAGISKDGAGIKLVQTTATPEWSWRNTCILRRDLALVEYRLEIQNVAAEPSAFALRMCTTLSPGARGRFGTRHENLVLDTEQGLVEIDQTLPDEAFPDIVKNCCYFYPAWSNEPSHGWVSGSLPTPALRENWGAKVNYDNGDGMIILPDPEPFLGYYFFPGSTLEPVFRAVGLDKGQTWQATIRVASFSGAKGKKLAAATPLYAATAKPAVSGGKLTGEIIPFFTGTLRVQDIKGKTICEKPAKPTEAIALTGDLAGPDWKLVALDRAGKMIGSVDAAGRCDLAEVEVAAVERSKPVVTEDVYTSPEMTKRIESLLAEGDFTVYCDAEAKEAEQELAKRIAQRLGAGLSGCYPGGKMIVVGNPANNAAIRDAGLLKNSISADWPGAGKGAVLAYDNFELEQQPLILVAGSDVAGTVKAGELFLKTFLDQKAGPTGFAFWATTTDRKVYPYDRPPRPAPEKIVLEAARSEYEPAQMVITAYEDLGRLAVTCAPLVHAESGKPMAGNYLTAFRKQNAPLWMRWVNYYPVEPERWIKGWSGYPDPLLERPEITLKAGHSQALWLTAVIPDDVPAGIYKTTVTCAANGEQKSIPVEVRVWDFVLPKEGLLGEPYMSFYNFPHEDRKELSDYDIHMLVTDFVEHGMRIMQVPGFPAIAPDLLRWHFSPKGEFKGQKFDWLETSEDGTIALDASEFDHFIEVCEQAAKPFRLRYTLFDTIGLANGWHSFSRAMPKRYADRPKREGQVSQSYYAEEILRVFVAHLKARGWLDRMALKLGDEPPSFNWWWDNMTLAARQAGMPFVTTFNKHMDWPSAEKALTDAGPGKLMVWEPSYENFNEAFAQKAQAAGQLAGWYSCGLPPRINIQAPATEIRANFWQAAKADTDVIVWWGIQNWHCHNEDWRSRYSHHNQVVYPAHPTKPRYAGERKYREAPIDSIRWELIREGMEDSRYVTLLRSGIAAARKAGRNEAADKAQVVLDEIWRTSFPTLADLNPPYDTIFECRRKLAQAILDLGPPDAK